MLSIPIHKCLVFIVVPPEKPRIYTVDDSQEVRLKLGPYNIGDTVRLRCVSLGGHPQPKVTWWRDHALLDSSDSNQVSFKTENELILKDLQRDDLHSILTCQASNNNISVPVSTSVKLDMNCKYIAKRSRCVKITEKVSFNIARETSYVYILSDKR